MALMVRKTRDSMINSTVLFLQRRIIGPDPHVTHFPTKHRFEYHNGSVLAYGGMADEAQREQIRSIGLAGGLDIAWAEEATASPRMTTTSFSPVSAATLPPGASSSSAPTPMPGLIGSTSASSSAPSE